VLNVIFTSKLIIGIKLSTEKTVQVCNCCCIALQKPFAASVDTTCIRIAPCDVTSGILVEKSEISRDNFQFQALEGMASGDVDGVQTRRSGRGVGSMPVTPPPGLQAIYAECSRVYPDQRNPLQVAAVVKYWYGNNITGSLARFSAVIIVQRNGDIRYIELLK